MLAATVEQIQQVTHLAVQINAATAQWKLAQETAGQTVSAAGQIADRITTEAKAFSEFMAKANDAEKAHLRLEVEKLRRGEAEWLQVLVRIFDHIYAIYQAGLRSGKPGLGEQLGNFQNACRDIIRRVGLVPFEAQPGEPYNPQLHNLLDAEAKPGPAAAVAETIATGFTYQGQLVRPALVSLQPAPAADPPAAAPPAAPPPTGSAS
jgi:molecular chaperone GrpE (heat shock protein)